MFTRASQSSCVLFRRVFELYQRKGQGKASHGRLQLKWINEHGEDVDKLGNRDAQWNNFRYLRFEFIGSTRSYVQGIRKRVHVLIRDFLEYTYEEWVG